MRRDGRRPQGPQCRDRVSGVKQICVAAPGANADSEKSPLV
jgi:hypothetical protein